MMYLYILKYIFRNGNVKNVPYEVHLTYISNGLKHMKSSVNRMYQCNYK